jgi:uncharacterized membrane protein YjgN (DUF898 family)
METLEPAITEAALPPPAPPVRHELEFRGSAAEYFRIWIVNLALTLVTLGVYSAWAKVRKLKYLHGQTFLAGSSFGYHGEPKQILKGRAIASLLVLAYVALGQLNPLAGAVAGLLLTAAMPWLVVKAMKFRTRMTSWRGIRFDFNQDFAGAFKVYIGWGLLAVLSLGLLFPVFVRKQHQFVLGNTAFGSTYMDSSPPLGELYRAVLIAVGAGILLFGAVIGVLTLVGPTQGGSILFNLMLVLIFVPYVAIYALYKAGVTNAVYNNSGLGPHRFGSQLSRRRLTWLYLTNVVAIVASLGLLIPWATIRLLRYRLETFHIDAHGSLDDFAASQAQARPGAAGEEISDFFDVDFGL